MEDSGKTREELLEELKGLKRKVSFLEEAELRWRDAEERIFYLVKGTASYLSEDYLHRLTECLAKALRVRYAFISELCEINAIDRVRLVSFWTGSGHGENFEYGTKGTPCEHVVAKNIACFPSGVQNLFPKDAWLREEGIESYLAIPLFDSAGAPLGHMGVMDNSAMAEMSMSEATLRVFAARAASEMERKKAEDRINFLAHFDSLTGLPNRQLFYDRLGQTMAYAERNGQSFALLFLDLDGFKGINDRFGHEHGDILLKEVGSRLKGCVRVSDTAARIAGDEFTFIVRDLKGEADAVLVAGKIMAELKRPFEVDGGFVTLGGSIGISVYPTDGADPATLLRNADKAMYRAKNAGGDRHELFSAAKG